MATFTIFCAQYLLGAIIVALIGVLVKAGAHARRVLLLRGVIVLVLGVALAKGGGAMYDDPRPFVLAHATPLIAHAPDNGFPSDHSLVAFGCALLLVPFSIPAATVSAVLGVVIGVARVASQLHHVVDVVASFAFAALANLAAARIVKLPPE